MSTSTVPRTKRRVTQPPTSLEAAASIDKVALSNLQTWVLAALEREQMTDGELVDKHRNAYFYREIGTKATPQRIRTARREIADLGLVEAVGIGRTPLGRKTQIWGIK